MNTVFFTCQNYGVTALVSKAVLTDTEKAASIRAALNLDEHLTVKKAEQIEKALANLKTKPVFTFTSMERAEKSPWFTGSTHMFELLVAHIRAAGGEVIESGFYVPFSNRRELGIVGDEEQMNELSYVTSSEDFEATFGITVYELALNSRLNTPAA